MSDYFADQKFQKAEFKDLPKGTYEACEFSQLNLTSVNITDYVFVDCEFDECDLTGAKLHNTALRGVQFSHCKLLGLQFEDCNKFLFEACFSDCQLNLAGFYQLNLKKGKFTNCTLQEADFTECDLRESKFDGCDLAGAVFDHTNLESADLRGASNYQIDPESNNVKKARFSLDGLIGLLSKYNIKVS